MRSSNNILIFIWTIILIVVMGFIIWVGVERSETGYNTAEKQIPNRDHVYDGRAAARGETVRPSVREGRHQMQQSTGGPGDGAPEPMPRSK